MSYSFSIRAASAAAAVMAIAAEFDKVVEAQPIHAADRAQAEAVAGQFIALLAEPGEGEELAVNVSGSVCKNLDADVLTSAGVSVSAWVLQKTG